MFYFETEPYKFSHFFPLLTFYSTHAIMYVLPKVNPEPIIKKVAMTYLGVHPYVLYLFMREQQEIETFLEIFLQSESLLLLYNK